MEKKATAQVYKVVGNNYSMERLVEWIESAPDRTEILMYCLTALTPNKKVENKKSDLRKKFLRRYLPEIREIYQVPYREEPFQRWVVNDEKAFIHEMLELKNKGYFPRCSYKKLSVNLYKHFDLNMSQENIYQVMRYFLYKKEN